MRARLIGAPYGLSKPSGTVEERFLATGQNTGNLLIGDAVVRLVDATITGHGTGIDPARCEAENDIILIAAANFLHAAFDFSWMADFLEKVRLPVVMMGLGAQAPDFGSAPELPEGTLRMLRIVSERCASISVRGLFTAELMSRLGFPNVLATGCPSILRGLWPDISMRSLPSGRPLKIVLNGSRNVVGHSFSRTHAIAVERQILALGIAQGLPYVLQNEFPEFHYALGSATETHHAEAVEIVTSLDLGVPAHAYADYFRDHGRVFFQLNEWKAFVGSHDLSIGSRFHGNVMALSQGMPAIVIVHDSRTREMCELMHIPHVLVTDIERVEPERLVEAADFDGFRQQVRKLYINFAQFLDRNRVPHRLTQIVQQEREMPLTLSIGGRLST